VLSKITRITTLGLNSNQISDLSPLKKQEELSLLMLESNKIKDLTPLVEMCQADAKKERRFAPYLRLYITKSNPLGPDAQKQLATLKEIGVRVH
jgi:Leucine-rich repeat (LRR) protein